MPAFCPPLSPLPPARRARDSAWSAERYAFGFNPESWYPATHAGASHLVKLSVSSSLPFSAHVLVNRLRAISSSGLETLRINMFE